MLNESKIALGTVQFGIDYGISSIDGQVQPKEVEAIKLALKSNFELSLVQT
jgi:hypothetical protein